MNRIRNIPNLGNTCCPDSIISSLLLSGVPYSNSITLKNMERYIYGLDTVYNVHCSTHTTRDSNDVIDIVKDSFLEFQVINWEMFDINKDSNFVTNKVPITIDTIKDRINKHFIYINTDLACILLNTIFITTTAFMDYLPIAFIVYNSAHYVCIVAIDGSWYWVDDMEERPILMNVLELQDIESNTFKTLSGIYRITGILYEKIVD